MSKKIFVKVFWHNYITLTGHNTKCKWSSCKLYKLVEKWKEIIITQINWKGVITLTNKSREQWSIIYPKKNRFYYVYYFV